MTLNDQKNLFSQAVTEAVAAVAGVASGKWNIDDDSVDTTFMRRGMKVVSPIPGKPPVRHSPKLDVQLKCTENPHFVGTDLHFSLPLKNYDDLRTPAAMLMDCRILVVVVVPDNVDAWLACSSAQYVLMRCAYWVSLAGLPQVQNTASVTVKLPGTNLFTPDALTSIFDKATCGVPL